MHARWIDLHHTAARHRLATRSPLLTDYLAQWLREVIAPFATRKTTETYTAVVARYITPYPSEQRLDGLSVADVRRWLHRLATGCQCCVQGKDAARRRKDQRCCALGYCCGQRLSRRTVLDAPAVLRCTLTEAVANQLISHNPAAVVRLPPARPRRMTAWTADEARRFLASARSDHGSFYAGYLLLVCLGLRRGELPALRWDDIDLDTASIHVHCELQRVDGRLLLTDIKTLDADAGLPLPPLCIAALRDRAASADQEPNGGFAISTRSGGPVDPRNFYRAASAARSTGHTDASGATIIRAGSSVRLDRRTTAEPRVRVRSASTHDGGDHATDRRFFAAQRRPQARRYSRCPANVCRRAS